jgi:hypothetical protein
LLSKCSSKNKIVKKQIWLNGIAYTFVIATAKLEAEEVVMIFLTTLTNAANAAKLYAQQGLAILTAKCFRFIDFLKYLFSILNPNNHAFCKNVQ